MAEDPDHNRSKRPRSVKNPTLRIRDCSTRRMSPAAADDPLSGRDSSHFRVLGGQIPVLGTVAAQTLGKRRWVSRIASR
jgi:hypothetical protein